MLVVRPVSAAIPPFDLVMCTLDASFNDIWYSRNQQLGPKDGKFAYFDCAITVPSPSYLKPHSSKAPTCVQVDGSELFPTPA